MEIPRDGEDFVEIMAKIMDVCHKAGIRVGRHIVEPDFATLLQETLSMNFVAWGTDLEFIRKGAKRE